MMKKIIWICTLSYFIPSIIWILLSGGENLSDIRSYNGLREYNNIIYDVYYAGYDNNLIYLCANGVLADSKRYPVEQSDFSFTIPIKDLNINSNENAKPFSNSNWLLVSDELLQNGCDIDPFYKNIAIVKLELKPKDVLSPWGAHKIKENITQTNDKFTITLIPQAKSYPYMKFNKVVQVILNGSPALNFEKHIFEIKLMDSIIERDIGLNEYVVAFIRDVFEFPVQLFSTLFNYS